jgi:PAS domain S-box-containing protein
MAVRDFGTASQERSGGDDRFERFLENLPGLGWIKDLEGRYTFVNGAAEQAFQRPRQEILGRTDEELFPAEIASQFSANDRKALKSKSAIRTVEQLEHDDGLVHHSLVTKFPIHGEDGTVIAVGGMAVDITERKQAEEMLQAVLSSIGDHLVTYDRNWRFTHVNEAACAVLGKPREELIGECIWELWPEAVGNEYHKALHKAMETQEIVRFEHLYEPFGRWYENHIYPSRDGTTVFSADITWRKEMEQKLEKLAQERAEADRRKDEFLAMLSHELRNPLAPLSNAIQMLGLVRRDDQAFERTRAMMERQVRQLSRLMDDLLDTSRITRGNLEVRMERVDLLSAVQRALESSMPLMETMEHRLRIQAPEEPIWMDADLPRLAQVFTNLLNNAARYTPPGGTIELCVRLQQNCASVLVRDNGIGIDPKRLNDIFELFIQLDEGSELAREGLGLGLTLVRKIVELHGGTVAARSEGPGAGAEFEVLLPLAKGPEPATSDSRGFHAAEPKVRRVLVVDDNVDSAHTMEIYLNMEGHEVRMAHDGPSALELAREWQPEVLLLDIGLPGMTGYELAEALRQEPWAKASLFVAMTGWGQEEDKRRSLEAGFDRHMTKPLQLDDLLRLIRSHRMAKTR